MNKWNISYAKTHFSAILEESRKEPQVICKHNSPYAVLMNIDELDSVKEKSTPSLLNLIDELREIQKSEEACIEFPVREDRSFPENILE